MHGCTHKWLAWTLAVAVGCGITGLSKAQENPSAGYSMAGDDSRAAPAQNSQPGQNLLISNNEYSAADQDLASEVAKLKADLQKIKDKEAADKKKAGEKPSVVFGGRIQWDTAAFSQNAESVSQAGDMLNGTEFRRVRLFAKGEAFDVVDYKLQVDFANPSGYAFRDVYAEIKELPCVGHVRFGQFYECWGLEQQTSSNNITFMERSVIAPVAGIGDRKPGVMAWDYNEAETMTWWVGGFAWAAPDTQNGAYPLGTTYDDGGYALDMRATYLPWYDEATEGRGLLHTGINYSYRSIATQTGNNVSSYRIRQRPDSHLANYVVDTGTAPMAFANRINSILPEMAFVYGPFSVQAEYEWSWVNFTNDGVRPFDGGYIYASYFLTGENRKYNRKEAIFDRVKPFTNFFRVRTEDGCVETGKGAWEVAYRVDYLNLNTLVGGAGRVTDQTLGLNWYLNPYTRMMLNYVHSETTDYAPAGKLPGRAIADIVETRVQIDF